MDGSHIATSPYHTITPKGSGPVVGFWVGFSLGTCCRIWLGPHIHFILIPDQLHTYRKCLKAFNHGWQWYCHITIPYHHSKRGGLGCRILNDFSLGTCCRIWLGPPIPCILIPDPLHTYKRCLACFICGGWPYCHNTIPYHHSASGSLLSRGVRSQFLAEMLLFRYDKSSHALHITHTNTRSTSYI